MYMWQQAVELVTVSPFSIYEDMLGESSSYEAPSVFFYYFHAEALIATINKQEELKNDFC